MIYEFKIAILFDGQTVEAEGEVVLGRFAEFTITAPYNPIKWGVVARDENAEIRQFYDFEEAKEYVEREVKSIMRKIGYVKQYREAYTEAMEFYNNRYTSLIANFKTTEEYHKVGIFQYEERFHGIAFGEYSDLLRQLIPTTDAPIIETSLLSKILKVI